MGLVLLVHQSAKKRMGRNDAYFPMGRVIGARIAGKEVAHGKDTLATLEVFLPYGAANRGFMEIQLLCDLGHLHGS